MTTRPLTLLLAAFALVALPSSAQQREDQLAVDLSGTWQFRTGDDPAWKLPTPDEGNWASVPVPGGWESAGFSEYDGFAWYRHAFKIPRSLEDMDLVLHLGRIDDVDEVYLNGMFIGATGGMPPNYFTAYNVERAYPVPPGVLDPAGENILAIRVYDATLDGGIMNGRVGISARAQPKSDLIRLDGVWSFRTGDDASWANVETEKTGWVPILVPGAWEPQGFRDYDGYAWYRREFYLPDQERHRDYTLVMGKIDDVDATYVNGKQVGHTGAIDDGSISSSVYRREREYGVPSEILRFGDYNVVAVRVFDGTGLGGLYEGPHALYPEDMEESALQSRLQALLRRVTGQ